jgi:mRNA interferase MazF
MRGQVFRVDLGHGPKPWLVVSNNQRNRHLDTVIAARITTTALRAHLPTVVPLTPDDPLVGYVLCDDLVQLHRDELDSRFGVLTPASVRAVSAALRIALP